MPPKTLLLLDEQFQLQHCSQVFENVALFCKFINFFTQDGRIEVLCSYIILLA